MNMQNKQMDDNA